MAAGRAPRARDTLLRLRPFRLGDEAAALAAEAALHAEGFQFPLEHRPGERWTDYLRRREANRRGAEVPPGFVPSTLLAACVDDQLVGRVSIRHELNDWLTQYGGHVGYAVVPDMRRRGYATEILRQGLVIARSLGIADVLVTCDVTNVVSARVIERCGGEYESTAMGSGAPKRRYWFR